MNCRLQPRLQRALNTGLKNLYFILQIMKSYCRDSGDGEPNNGVKRNDPVLTIRDGLKGSEAKRGKINREDVF